MQTTHLHLTPRLRMHGTKYPLPHVFGAWRQLSAGTTSSYFLLHKYMWNALILNFYSMKCNIFLTHTFIPPYAEILQDHGVQTWYHYIPCSHISLGRQPERQQAQSYLCLFPSYVIPQLSWDTHCPKNSSSLESVTKKKVKQGNNTKDSGFNMTARHRMDAVNSLPGRT